MKAQEKPIIFRCPKCDNYTTTHDYLIEHMVQVHGLPDPDKEKLNG